MLQSFCRGDGSSDAEHAQTLVAATQRSDGGGPYAYLGRMTGTDAAGGNWSRGQEETKRVCSLGSWQPVGFLL